MSNEMWCMTPECAMLNPQEYQFQFFTWPTQMMLLLIQTQHFPQVRLDLAKGHTKQFLKIGLL